MNTHNKFFSIILFFLLMITISIPTIMWTRRRILPDSKFFPKDFSVVSWNKETPEVLGYYSAKPQSLNITSIELDKFNDTTIRYKNLPCSFIFTKKQVSSKKYFNLTVSCDNGLREEFEYYVENNSATPVFFSRRIPNQLALNLLSSFILTVFISLVFWMSKFLFNNLFAHD